ncbi:DUF6879 family protein [Acrocarpospora sp. B8E8]|uniref:DUF6879 family protein n=1 Tax=Acrocarpospora sp. B8E8 TaxID=3153572 RepID=UPI00325D92BB
MELLKGDEFENLFRSFHRTAFHLELEDTYNTSDERGPFDRFLKGESDDFEWHRPWLDLVREVSDSGRRIERVRIVSSPYTDYTRWGMAVAPLNIAAGEDIRWLPRHLVRDIALPVDDFWLFDDSRLVFTVFETDGNFIGGVEARYPYLVGLCKQARDATWDLAVPHDDFVVR